MAADEAEATDDSDALHDIIAHVRVFVQFLFHIHRRVERLCTVDLPRLTTPPARWSPRRRLLPLMELPVLDQRDRPLRLRPCDVLTYGELSLSTSRYGPL